MKLAWISLILFLLCPLKSFSLQEKPLAFPTAEGFGRHTSGGRGGNVLIVTNLNDSGPGSLREAVNSTGKRTIVFQVSGNIELESNLTIKNGDLTIAGHSAPGDGITIQNYPLVLDADNLIIRYIRVRVGDKAKRELDAITGVKRRNLIIDHCSFSWGNDEVASFYDNENFTLQWSIISEGLHHSYHATGRAHGYGGLWGGKKASFHHNLMAHLYARLPRFNGSRYHKKPEEELVDFRNNVLYNWVNYSSYGGEGGNHNLINNYYKYGPATQEDQKYRMLRIMEPQGKFYITGNYIYGDPTGSQDNWNGGNWKGPVRGNEVSKARVQKPFPLSEISQDSPQQAFDKVLKNAGASYRRDLIDKRIVKEIENGTATYGVNGMIDSQEDVGGWPLLESKTNPKDSDLDGIPDSWELNNGLDPSDSSDSKSIAPNTHYSYLELYLEELLNPKNEPSSLLDRILRIFKGTR